MLRLPWRLCAPVDEHKRKIAEKLREMGSDGDLTSQHDMPASSGHAEGPGSGSVDQGNMPTQHDHPLQQETDDIVECKGTCLHVTRTVSVELHSYLSIPPSLPLPSFCLTYPLSSLSLSSLSLPPSL